MIEWFFARYATPEEAALFYDKEAGDFVWVGTGPDGPSAVLHDQFDTALGADIAEAADVITQHALDWAERDEL